MTKALAECAKCHVSDDHFEFRQLRGTCLGTGLTESTKYSAWDLGLPEITVYTELGGRAVSFANHSALKEKYEMVLQKELL